MALLAGVAAGCGGSGSHAAVAAEHSPTTPTRTSVTLAPSTAGTQAPTTQASTTSAPATSTPATSASATIPPSSAGGPGTFPPTATGPLTGKVVALDPGHNGGNFTDPGYVNSIIFNGRENETCDTTGAETDTGYTEAEFNFNVASDLTADLRAEGATVVLTRTTNTGVGPCVTQRAAIGNDAHANVALSIHADGGPPTGRGFAVLEPVADSYNSSIIAPSAVFGTDLRAAFAAGTGEPVSSYDGVDGIQPRDDLGGLNLSTVPKVFIECANMRNATDADLTTSPQWQALAATSIAQGITSFLS